jgi:phenylalanyl-tRNA synthetase beta chain
VADCGAVDARAEQYAAGFPGRSVLLRPERVNQVLGTAFSAAEIGAVMRRLSFATVAQASGFLVQIPSYRLDIAEEVDLIEEVARLSGYQHIPQVLPSSSAQGGRSPRQRWLLQLKQAAAAQGFFEAVNYSFISPREADRLELPPQHPWRETLNIDNPLSEEQSVMRRSLLPGLLNNAVRNQ